MAEAKPRWLIQPRGLDALVRRLRRHALVPLPPGPNTVRRVRRLGHPYGCLARLRRPTSARLHGLKAGSQRGCLSAPQVIWPLHVARFR